MADLPRDFRGQAYLLSDEIIDYLHGEFEAICQSPIEVAFGVAFVLVSRHLHGDTFFRSWEPGDLQLVDTTKRLIEAQVPVAGYRVDFVVSAWPRRSCFPRAHQGAGTARQGARSSYSGFASRDLPSSMTS